MRAFQRTAFIGIGNTLAGDDGAGPFMVSLLERQLPRRKGFSFHTISGDMYFVWDIMQSVDAILFLDSVAGGNPGEIRKGRTLPSAYTPSFHQTDVCTVMGSLETLFEGTPPSWNLWGVTIAPPRFLGEGLSPDVERACRVVVSEIVSLVTGEGLPVPGGVVKADA